jgi:hypothetical protein
VQQGAEAAPLAARYRIADTGGCGVSENGQAADGPQGVGGTEGLESLQGTEGLLGTEGLDGRRWRSNYFSGHV